MKLNNLLFLSNDVNGSFKAEAFISTHVAARLACLMINRETVNDYR